MMIAWSQVEATAASEYTTRTHAMFITNLELEVPGFIDIEKNRLLAKLSLFFKLHAHV